MLFSIAFLYYLFYSICVFVWVYFFLVSLILFYELRPWSEYLQPSHFSLVPEKTKVFLNFLVITNVKVILYLNLSFTTCCH